LTGKDIVLALDYVKVAKKTNELNINETTALHFREQEILETKNNIQEMVDRGYVMDLREGDEIIDTQIIYALDKEVRLEIGRSTHLPCVDQTIRRALKERENRLKEV